MGRPKIDKNKPRNEGELAPIKHVDFFTYFLKLGSGRTLIQVARDTETNPKTIQTWAAKEDWHKHIEKINKEIIESTKKEISSSIIEASNNIKRVAELGIAKYEKTLGDDNTVITTNDYKSLVAIMYEAMGTILGEIGDDLDGDSPVVNEQDTININVNFVDNDKGLNGDSDDKED